MNRTGDQAQSGGRGPIATDYGMAIMFALGATARVAGQAGLAVDEFDVH